MDYLQRAREIFDQMVRDRRHLHQNPEAGADLPKTTEYVAQRLREMGYRPQMLGGGVTACVSGNAQGRTFLLRADMDALPMEERSGLPFASQCGCAHTCGHDMHTAMLLGAAQLLVERKEELKGTVKLMFQPGEEVLVGAKSMIAAGIMENPHVDGAMGAHIAPALPVGIIGCNAGAVSVSSDHLVIRIDGKGGHGASPHTTVDPINIGVHIHLALQELLSREIDPAETVVLTFGKFHGGDAANIIPGHMVMEGTLRTYSEPLRKHILERIRQICDYTARAFHGSAEVTVTCSTCSLVLDEDTGRSVAREWRAEGLEVLWRDEKMSGSEDFAEVAARTPSTFFVVGGGAGNDKNSLSLHNPEIVFQEEALIYGAAAYASGAAGWLKEPG